MRETKVAISETHAGWMSPAVALCFVSLGGAVTSSIKKGGRSYLLQSLAAVLLFIGAPALLGYLFHTQALYVFPSYTLMALHTGLSFVLLSVALFCLEPGQAR
ncbi:MAG: hypothetical protein A4E19_15355 [Nitrospira sp. SG-bin1]|nr:MAG: hypothetical protein A4E19_15355 [Nitrospira sp. SG-bin1]